jgi:nuclear cap-binding protein subunit 1
MDSHNPQKRSRDEFEADEPAHFQEPQQYEDNSGYEGKRQHIDPAQQLITNVCKDIRRLGENPNITNQIDDVSYISNPIVAEFEKIDNLRNAILNTVYAIVLEQPQKINALSNLILICNAKNFVVAKYVIEFLHAKAQSMLDNITDPESTKKSTRNPNEDAGVFNNIKSILKFLAALTPIIDNYSIVNIFKQFLTLAMDLQNQTPEERNGLAQGIYYNVLVSIPYLFSNEFSPEIIEKANSLLDLAQDFKIVEVSSNLLLQPFDSKLENYQLPYEPKKIIDLILPSLVKLQGEDKQWTDLKNSLFLNFIELVQPIINEALLNNTISNELVKHQIPQLSLPEVTKFASFKPHGLIDELWYKNSRVLFQVYNSTEFETVPQIESYFGLFFKDLSFDILTNLSFNKNEASIQLSILDLYFSKDLFAPPGSSIDQLTMIHKDNQAGENTPPLSTWKIEDIAVESILTMIFQLPATLHFEIYYYTVLISCCRESPESIAPVFGRAIRYLYNNLETLDYELKIRFLDWMTTQISNFEFSWKWDEWVADSKKYRNLKYHPKKNFIKNLIAKEVRLSNKNRIKESLVTVDPETSDIVALDEFFKYLNVSFFDDDSKYVLEYDSELYGGSEEVRELLTKVYAEKKEGLAAKSMIAAQEEIFFNFSNPELPLYNVSNKVYDFIVAHWKPNNEFTDLYKEILHAAEKVDGINPVKFVINVFFQTYAFIGSRSIYSVVSILSRDINKLKFLSGAKIEYSGTEPQFEDLELTPEQVSERQSWIIDSIFRIWSHQPQVVFLILEYMIEFKIILAEFLIYKTVELSHNFIIENVSCMESINRVLQNSYTESKDEFKKLILSVFTCIVTSLNQISQRLQADDHESIQIIKDFEDESIEDKELMNKIDDQWLYYEYKGLLKSYFRRFIKNEAVDYLSDINDIFVTITNEPAKKDVLAWISEASK